MAAELREQWTIVFHPILSYMYDNDAEGELVDVVLKLKASVYRH
jgi:hypothetical protein